MTPNNENKNEIYDGCILRPLIKQYMNENEYSLLDINNHFMKMLKLNSKAIFRKKGTIQAIESLLGIFGLKSKRWVELNKKKNYTADYEIKEYITATNYLKDEWVESKKMNENDWYNSTKTVIYNTDDYKNGIYHSYQGLPIRSYIQDDNKKYHQTDRLPVDDKGKTISVEGKDRYLFPYFSNDKLIDGNPYYQMNGGWLNRTPKIFDIDNNEVTSQTKIQNNNTVNIDLFKETYRNIRYVDKLIDLIKLPKTMLKNGDLCYVRDLTNQNYAIIDGEVYDIYKDNKGSYIRTYMANNACRVGSKMFASELTVSDPNNSSNNLIKYVFSELKENAEIRIYIIPLKIGNDTINTLKAYGKYYSINNVMFFYDEKFNNSYDFNNKTKINEQNTTTHYFKLNNIEYKTELGNGRGWEMLENDNPTFKRIKTVVDKFKGNNPHTGHMHYDGGAEYISYFTQLFKHALNGNQFNERCYGDDYYNELNKISDIGFNDLKSEYNETNSPYCYPEYGDIKIHYFGYEYKENNEKKKITLKEEYPNVTDNLITTDISDHIVNIKRIDINFINTVSNYIIKFMDNVVMSYLEQILPSTLIINVNYCKST